LCQFNIKMEFFVLRVFDICGDPQQCNMRV
jgi:hypothetical protein